MADAKSEAAATLATAGSTTTVEELAVESPRVTPREDDSALERVLSLVSEAPSSSNAPGALSSSNSPSSSGALSSSNSPSSLDSTSSPAVSSVGVESTTTAGLRVARLLELDGTHFVVESLDGNARFRARCAPFVELEFAADALKEGQLALVEQGTSGALVVGFVQTQRSRVTHISSSIVEIEGKEEVVLRSGRAALRLRADGTVELLGTRISALSRGVLKLVGRALRLN